MFELEDRGGSTPKKTSYKDAVATAHKVMMGHPSNNQLSRRRRRRRTSTHDLTVHGGASTLHAVMLLLEAQRALEPFGRVLEDRESIDGSGVPRAIR